MPAAYQSIIDCDALLQHLGRDNWRIIDCRFSLANLEQGRTDYLASHIPGAAYAHLDADLSGPIIRGKTSRHPLPAIADFVETCSAWGIEDGVQVIAYDNGPGMIAARLWWMLRWLGHDSVAVLDGGWQAWKEARLPEETIVTPYPLAEFVAKPRRELLVDAEFVESILDKDDYLLLDSRAAERYRGEVEPLDPLAGHIPSALSLPFADNLNADSRMRSKDALRQRFSSAAKTVSPDKTIFYCGSGVSACQNILAWYHAGMGDVALYAGSWSEWITEPDRPVVLKKDIK